MFVGIDHGTQAIRLATTAGRCWELPRKEASQLSSAELMKLLKDRLALSNVDMVALTYSMGDGLTKIIRMEDAKNRGLIQQDGAGLHIGGGTNVFETIKSSGWPCVLLPGTLQLQTSRKPKRPGPPIRAPPCRGRTIPCGGQC